MENATKRIRVWSHNTIHNLSLTQSGGLFSSGGHQTDQQLTFLLLTFHLNWNCYKDNFFKKQNHENLSPNWYCATYLKNIFSISGFKLLWKLFSGHKWTISDLVPLLLFSGLSHFSVSSLVPTGVDFSLLVWKRLFLSLRSAPNEIIFFPAASDVSPVPLLKPILWTKPLTSPCLNILQTTILATDWSKPAQWTIPCCKCPFLETAEVFFCLHFQSVALPFLLEW